MLPSKVVNVDVDTYERLRHLASKLRLSVSSVIRLLVFSVDVEESSDEVIVFLRQDSPFKKRRIKVLDTSYYNSLLNEITRLKAENKALAKENEKLRKRVRMLEEHVIELVKNKNKEGEGEEERHVVEVHVKPQPYPFSEPSIVKALREHGLLGLAQKWLRGESDELLKYVSEDAVYSILYYKDYVLSAKNEDEEREPRKLYWII